MSTNGLLNGFRKGLAVGIAFLAIGFFVYYAMRNFSEIPAVELSYGSTLVALISIVVYVMNIAVGGTIWRLLLHDIGFPISWRQALTIFAIAQFAKYIPGNVSQHVGRVILGKGIGIPVPIALSTMLIEILWGSGVAVGLAILALLFFVTDRSLGWHLGLGSMELGLVAASLISAPWLVIVFLKYSFPKLAIRLAGGVAIKTPSLSTALAVGSLFIICFFIMGILLKIQAQWFFGVTAGDIIELTCLFAIAWLAGYLLPGAPGGLGVREAMMVILLSPVVGPGGAVGARDNSPPNYNYR